MFGRKVTAEPEPTQKAEDSRAHVLEPAEEVSPSSEEIARRDDPPEQPKTVSEASSASKTTALPVRQEPSRKEGEEKRERNRSSSFAKIQSALYERIDASAASKLPKDEPIPTNSRDNRGDCHRKPALAFKPRSGSDKCEFGRRYDRLGSIGADLGR